MQIDPNQIWTQYGETFIAAALNILAAVLILVGGIWLSAWAANAVRSASRRHPRIDDTLAVFFSWIVRYGIMGFVIVAVLNRFGVATTSIVAVIGAGALAIGLALQGTLSNVAAGVMLILFRPYRLGDLVELSGRLGTVADVSLFTTELTTPENQKVVVPNALCWGNPMINYTAHPRRRIDLEFGVAYDTDLDHAIAVLENVLEAEQRVLKEPAPQVHVTNLGDFAITLLVRVWGKTGDYLDLKYGLIKAGKDAFDAHGIAIPFPTATNYEIHMQAEEKIDAPKLTPRARAPRSGDADDE